MWLFHRKGPSGFSFSSTAEEVTQGIDGNGLTAIVTCALLFFICGASSGIGRETARVLALRGVHVVMAVRNVASGNTVKQEILEIIPSAKIDVIELDLSSMASVRKFASEFNATNLPLNILISNAGIMGTPFSLSQDGLELQFATNHIGHFLLTNLLLEKMKSTSQSSNIEGRIINVSSVAHKYAIPERICFDNINQANWYGVHYGYVQSKLANVLHANELSRRLKKDGANITANSLHPGVIRTNIFRFGNALMNVATGAILDWGTKNVEQGAATTCYVALNPQVKGITGKYFKDCNLCMPSSKALDQEIAKKLWDFSMTITQS